MEFLEAYEKMIQEAYIELEYAQKYKLKSIKKFSKQLVEREFQSDAYEFEIHV